MSKWDPYVRGGPSGRPKPKEGWFSFKLPEAQSVIAKASVHGLTWKFRPGHVFIRCRRDKATDLAEECGCTFAEVPEPR